MLPEQKKTSRKCAQVANSTYTPKALASLKTWWTAQGSCWEVMILLEISFLTQSGMIWEENVIFRKLKNNLTFQPGLEEDQILRADLRFGKTPWTFYVRYSQLCANSTNKWEPVFSKLGELCMAYSCSCKYRYNWLCLLSRKKEGNGKAAKPQRWKE